MEHINQKKQNVIISPSILSADFANLERDIKNVESAGADWLHIDVMDGHFVPNITIGIPVIKSIRHITNLPFDVHLMIDNPDKYIESFANAGANIITFHYETGVNIVETLNKIKSYGLKAGLSIKPNTKAEEIEEFISTADLILVMTVEPGFGGQTFIQKCADKLPYIKSKQNINQILQVDGGINSNTGDYCKKMGANSLVAGNYIFNNDNIEFAISSLKQFPNK